MKLNCSFENDLNASIWSYASLGGSILSLNSVCAKIMLTNSQDRDAFVWVALNVMSMSTVCLVMSVTWNYGGVCRDNLNVTSQRMVWIATSATYPLLNYLTIVIIEKASFEMFDYLLMGSSCLGLLAELINCMKQPIWMAMFWLAVSCVAASISVIHPLYYWKRTFLSSITTAGSYRDRSIRRFQLAILLTAHTGLFGIIYFLGFLGILKPGQTVELFNCCSVMINGMNLLTVIIRSEIEIDRHWG